MRVDTGVLHSSRSGVVVKTSSSVPSTLRFGVFELDPRAGELRKKGMKIRLQGQPVEILVMLLERPGEIVTREELQKKLWPADTFVDFEQGLNNAMKRLRSALDDDAESPHFIETPPRHGYRFIGSVSGQAHAEEAKTTRSAGALFRRLALGALAVLAVVAVLVGLNVRGWRDSLFIGSPKPQIQALAVLPLTNLSGDPEQEYFADGMTEALITELGKVSGPRVISRQSIMQYKGSKKSLREIAGELKVDAVLEGAVERSGDRVRVTMHLSQALPERQLWAQEYNRSLRDALSLQGEIARAYRFWEGISFEKLVGEIQSAQVIVLRFRVDGATDSKASSLLRRQLDLDFIGDGVCNFALQTQSIPNVAIARAWQGEQRFAQPG